jgi:hypothetical protein
MAQQYVTLAENAYYLKHFDVKYIFLMKSDMQVKLAQKFSNFLLNKISFDTTLNFNQVALPYPVWNWVNSFRWEESPCRLVTCHILSETVFFFFVDSL